ncbi:MULTISPECIES: dihydroxyacetone kinase subunit DhaL [Clostridium]|jgi:dihydroxyacetone kinase-like protein|uniref:Dihydroxyacetone kinase DhaL subunit n=1 Tax=Clostridium cochlearium TaxID=1494 RepID=A0ABY0QLH3_CLOCO|nr:MULTISPECIES: dihydroxyacetone kinase subunit DhaL [Clostridium]MBE6043522.1 dihydroxyacetone kinase subunit L [Clostridium thermopalmarium]MBE6064886.1 dihydroxyacetone kinase subunit L [Clostridium cochlearium]NME96137.1 dihydroxyacetone kinase subunit L [Clostridium cochlearium]SDL16421.1 dihydroxyacetone kinase DhaL subunit [Clostridium cochlearium]SNV82192.1 dihydroxyacetone kinase [Clostridium cochlearium]
MSLKLKDVEELVKNIGKIMEENKEFLTELDLAIGDGDHGINMNKGFKAVTDKLENTSINTIQDIFKNTAMALISNVGGASGPLYGTIFMKASSVVGGKEELNIEDFEKILEASLEGVKARGKAQKGDKTMIDAIEPSLEALKTGIKEGLNTKKILENMKNEALNGVNYTKDIIARKGRASYLGERSIGHQDPGATSSYLILNEIYKYICEK